MYILNAFSANMLSTFPVEAQFVETSLEEAKALAVDCKSAVGHVDTAAVFANVLGCPVLASRVNVVLSKGDQALLGQYRGPRLAEGATTLPSGATIQWLRVSVR